MQIDIDSTAKIANGVKIPLIGFGVFRSPAGEVTSQAVGQALVAGYRHIDTARIYGNERAVGQAIRESGLAREEIFVTTKLWNADHGYEAAIAACLKSTKELDLDYIDLYLIHWPVEGKRLDSWRALETLLADGKCRAIGVSNYMVTHLKELIANCTVLPQVNQIELSPYNYVYRQEVVDLCRTNQIQLVAYSPLTKGKKLKDPALMDVAATYTKTPAQILIRWALQHKFVVIPKSVNPNRIRENADVFDFTISGADMDVLDGFNENLITGWDPTDVP